MFASCLVCFFLLIHMHVCLLVLVGFYRRIFNWCSIFIDKIKYLTDVQRLLATMARVPDKIKCIDGSMETLKLFVRIIDLWFIGGPWEVWTSRNGYCWFWCMFSPCFFIVICYIINHSIMYLYILYIIGGCNSCCLQTRPTKVLLVLLVLLIC